MAHDSPDRTTRPAASSNRSFGSVFAIVFASIALCPLAAGHPPKIWALLVAALFAGAVILAPSHLAPLNRLWTMVGACLHRIVSPIVLAFIFFVVITPTGMLMRLLGKHPLQLRFDKAATSYWIVRRPPGPAPETLKDQF